MTFGPIINVGDNVLYRGEYHKVIDVILDERGFDDFLTLNGNQSCKSSDVLHLQKTIFECIVTDIDDCIHVDMYAINEENPVVEFAEIFKDAFVGVDPNQLSEGSVFYWSIDRLTNEYSMELSSDELVAKLKRSFRT